MRKKAATKRSKSSTVNKLNRQLMLVSLNYIAEKNVNEKQKNDGRIPWGFVARLLKEGKETFPSMSMRTVNNYVKRIEKRSGTVIKPTSSILVDKNSATNITTISSLTGDSETTTGDSNGSTDSESEVESINSGSNGSADGSAYSESTVESIRLGGCPRGSTAAYSLELRKKAEAATKECVSLLSDLQREMK